MRWFTLLVFAIIGCTKDATAPTSDSKTKKVAAAETKPKPASVRKVDVVNSANSIADKLLSISDEESKVVMERFRSSHAAAIEDVSPGLRADINSAKRYVDNQDDLSRVPVAILSLAILADPIGVQMRLPENQKFPKANTESVFSKLVMEPPSNQLMEIERFKSSALKRISEQALALERTRINGFGINAAGVLQDAGLHRSVVGNAIRKGKDTVGSDQMLWFMKRQQHGKCRSADEEARLLVRAWILVGMDASMAESIWEGLAVKATERDYDPFNYSILIVP